MSKRQGKRALRRAAAASRASATVPLIPGADTRYRASSRTDAAMAAWLPMLRDANYEGPGDRDLRVARGRDLVENDALAASAVSKAVAMTVGRNMRFSAHHVLMAQRLGIDVEAAGELAAQIESCLNEWGGDPLARCDWSRKLDLGQILEQTFRHKYVDGDGFVVIRFDTKTAPGWQWQTSCQVVDPDRCSNPLGRGDNKTLINGVELDPDARFVSAYHFQNAHPSQWGAQGSSGWLKVDARAQSGRPIVLHLFDQTRAGLMRGVSKLVPVLKRFKMLSSFTESEVSAAAINALIAAVIYSSREGGDVQGDLGLAAMNDLAAARDAYYGAGGADMRLSDASRIAHLMPGDRLEMLTAQRYKEPFGGFKKAITQDIAGGLDLSTSQLTNDFSGASFSSWKGEMLDVWRLVLEARTGVVKQVANPIALCIIEEGITKGRITPPPGCPGLYENPNGWLAGEWIGPSRGSIDPVKDVQASDALIAGGYSTHEREALELTGADYAGVAGQLAHEREIYAAAGLKTTALRLLAGEPSPGAAAPAEDPADETPPATPPAQPTDATPSEAGAAA